MATLKKNEVFYFAIFMTTFVCLICIQESESNLLLNVRQNQNKKIFDTEKFQVHINSNDDKEKIISVTSTGKQLRKIEASKNNANQVNLTKNSGHEPTHSKFSMQYYNKSLNISLFPNAKGDSSMFLENESVQRPSYSNHPQQYAQPKYFSSKNDSVTLQDSQTNQSPETNSIHGKIFDSTLLDFTEDSAESDYEWVLDEWTPIGNKMGNHNKEVRDEHSIPKIQLKPQTSETNIVPPNKSQSNVRHQNYERETNNKARVAMHSLPREYLDKRVKPPIIYNVEEWAPGDTLTRNVDAFQPHLFTSIRLHGGNNVQHNAAITPVGTKKNPQNASFNTFHYTNKNKYLKHNHQRRPNINQQSVTNSLRQFSRDSHYKSGFPSRRPEQIQHSAKMPIIQKINPKINFNSKRPVTMKSHPVTSIRNIQPANFKGPTKSLKFTPSNTTKNNKQRPITKQISTKGSPTRPIFSARLPGGHPKNGHNLQHSKVVFQRTSNKLQKSPHKIETANALPAFNAEPYAVVISNPIHNSVKGTTVYKIQTGNSNHDEGQQHHIDANNENMKLIAIHNSNPHEHSSAKKYIISLLAAAGFSLLLPNVVTVNNVRKRRQIPGECYLWYDICRWCHFIKHFHFLLYRMVRVQDGFISRS